MHKLQVLNPVSFIITVAWSQLNREDVCAVGQSPLTLLRELVRQKPLPGDAAVRRGCNVHLAADRERRAPVRHI